MIENKVVIINGASSGIGEATARLLASRGAKVVLGARRTKKLALITKSIIDDGGIAIYQATDVTDRERVKALIDLAIEKLMFCITMRE